MIQKWKQQNGLYWLILLSIFCFGGFYDWTAAFLGAAVCIMAILRINEKKQCIFVCEKWFWLLIVLGGCLLCGTFWAVDRGMNWVGVLRFLPVVAWGILCMQYSKEERQAALEAIPSLGCMIVVVSSIAFFLPGLQDMFWAAQRMGGFFQYSNTCGIFFLLSLVLVGEKDGPFTKWQWTILFWGILLTGSRTVMLFLLVILVVQVFSKKYAKSRKIWILGNTVIAVVAAVLMALVMGNYQNLARLATVFTTNSTFYGRLLYWQDALKLILEHPMGLGWKGYYYVQPAIQTGVYTTVYVHNDLLQWFLDGGWICGVAFGALMVLQLKKSSYRGVLGLLLLHSLADVDFQYISIWFVAILLFDFGKTTVITPKQQMWKWQIVLGGLAGICLYFCIPFMAEFQGNYKLAADLYPRYTQAKENLLAQTGEAVAAERLADEIITRNPYVALAYDAKAYAAYSRGDIQEFVENKERVLDLARYDITQYQDYSYLLKQYCELALANGDFEMAEYCRERQRGILELLERVKQQTGSLAWKLRDQPVFVLEESE